MPSEERSRLSFSFDTLETAGLTLKYLAALTCTLDALLSLFRRLEACSSIFPSPLLAGFLKKSTAPKRRASNVIFEPSPVNALTIRVGTGNFTIMFFKTESPFIPGM